MVLRLVLLNSLAPSCMTTKTVCKTSRPMDTPGFFPKVPDQFILDRQRIQDVTLSDAMTVLA